VAGQHQRQELRDNSQSLSWQHAWSRSTVSNLAYFRRFSQSRLYGSPFDTPIFASQNRRHARHGFLASITFSHGRHSLKAGVETAPVSPSESFVFAVTESEEAEDQGISEDAREYDREHPFMFQDRRARGTSSFYIQDVVSRIEDLTLSLGCDTIDPT